MSDSIQPVVTGPEAKYAGLRYKLGKRPYCGVYKSTNTNVQSWRIIEAIMDAYGSADFWDLCCACRDHQHGDKSKVGKGPQSWIRYLIRGQYLAPVKG